MTPRDDDPRTLHVEHCMGTVFTIDIRDAGYWGEAIGDVVDWLHHVDAVFSTYHDDSDISRLRRGELAVKTLTPTSPPSSPSARQLRRRRRATSRAFRGTASTRPGLVKGWAIEQASRLLAAHGSHNHAVNGGGDIQLAGEAAPGRAVDRRHQRPARPDPVLTIVTGRNFAIATSGVAERGAHIMNPYTAAPADRARQRHRRRPLTHPRRCLCHRGVRHGIRRP